MNFLRTDVGVCLSRRNCQSTIIIGHKTILAFHKRNFTFGIYLHNISLGCYVIQREGSFVGVIMDY